MGIKQGEGEGLRKVAKPGASYSLPNRQVEERLNKFNINLSTAQLRKRAPE
jgi:hypothetical protein